MPIRKTKVSYTLDLSRELRKFSRSEKKQIKDEIALAVLSLIEKDLSSQKSSVTSEKFPKLSKEYAKTKRKAVGNNKANLQLFGDMLNDLKFDTPKDSIVFKITDSTQKKKAYNHNSGDTVPQRRFLPDDNGKPKSLPTKVSDNTTTTFSSEISRTIRSIIASHREDKA